MRRAAMALRECGSSDIFTAARAVLEAAIRSENDLIELLSPDTAAMSALPRRADVVSPAGHVGYARFRLKHAARITGPQKNRPGVNDWDKRFETLLSPAAPTG
jgi:hypothetical protein